MVVGRNPLVTFIRLILTVSIILIVTKTILLPIRVTGHSMEPTYRDGRFNMLNLLAYQRSEPKRGDVVGIRRTGHRMIVLKRILGLPGERVLLRGGVVRINGVPLEEPYARGHSIPSMKREIELGPTQYFAVGDNRDVTAYSDIERSEILGKILF